MHWRAEQVTAARRQGDWCTGAQSEAGLDRAGSGRSSSNDWSSNRPRQTPNAWALVHAEIVDRTFRGSIGAALDYPGCQHARGASSPSHTARIPPPRPFCRGTRGWRVTPSRRVTGTLSRRVTPSRRGTPSRRVSRTHSETVPYGEPLGSRTARRPSDARRPRFARWGVLGAAPHSSGSPNPPNSASCWCEFLGSGFPSGYHDVSSCSTATDIISAASNPHATRPGRFQQDSDSEYGVLPIR